MIDYFYVPAFEEKSQSVVYVYAGVKHVIAERTIFSLTPVAEPEPEVKVEVPKEEEKRPKLVVYFSFNKSRLMPEEREKLKSLKPSSYLVVGHADWIGSERYNLVLSKLRVKEVGKVLKGLGSEVKLSWKGEQECKIKSDLKGKALIDALRECRKVEIW